MEIYNFTVLVHSQCSHSIVFREKAVKAHCTLPAQQQTVEHLAAKETDISLRRWRRPKTELKEREYLIYIHQVTQTRLQINDNVAPQLLDV